MLNKIDIPGTTISLGIKREKRHLAELQKFFEFIENNKRNLFDLCGIKGELQ